MCTLLNDLIAFLCIICNKDKSQKLEKKIQEMENNIKDPGRVLSNVSNALYTNFLICFESEVFLQ